MNLDQFIRENRSTMKIMDKLIYISYFTEEKGASQYDDTDDIVLGSEY